MHANEERLETLASVEVTQRDAGVSASQKQAQKNHMEKL